MKFSIPHILHWLWNAKYRMVSWVGGKVVGARALVLEGDKVLLVRHTYGDSWYTIGGAVDRGETPMQAMVRELKEEVGVIPLEPPKLMNVYYTNYHKRDDYVIFYTVHAFTRVPSNSPEIAEIRWFNLEALPLDVSPGTKRRIEEYRGIRIPEDNW